MQLIKEFTIWFKFKNGNFGWAGVVEAKNKTDAKRRGAELPIVRDIRAEFPTDGEVTASPVIPYKTFEEYRHLRELAEREQRYRAATKEGFY